MPNFFFKVSCVFLLTFSISFAFALAPNAVTITRVSGPNFNDDSNAACTGAGARGAYVAFKITNTTGATLNNLSADLNNLTVAAGNTFRLSGGQVATQYIGTLGTTAATSSKYIYWYVEYPCNKSGIACGMTCTVSDNAAGVVSATTSVATISSIGASSGGLITNAVLAPCAVIGQIVSYTVTYSFGGVGIGEVFDMQPVGNVGVSGFDAGAFQLINAKITYSDVPGIAVGATDKLYFTATGNNNGSSKIVTVVYYFECKKANIATFAKPYAAQTSGGQMKYTGNYGTSIISLPAATFPISISKRASPSNPNRGDLVTYTITLRNTSAYPTSVSSIKDALPAGLSFQGYSASSQVTASNSTNAPLANATGTMIWKGGAAATIFPYTNYYIAANDSIVLKYTALVAATVAANSVLTNTAKAYIGTDSTATVSAVICAQCTDTDGDGTPDISDNSVSVSGTVVHDTNALTDGIINGAGTNIGGSLYANLINSSGTLVQSVLVANNGAYAFANVVPGSDYKVIIATNNTATTPALPTAYCNTGAANNNTICDAVNGGIAITIPHYNTTGIIFGVQQTPDVNNSVAAVQINLGRSINVAIPSAAFSGTDADGIISNILISAFPTNATSITINNIVYTALNFPVAGVLVPTNAVGNPTETITVQPTDGEILLKIPYYTIDNAGAMASRAGSADFPFHVAPLPVKMLNFIGSVENCKVILRWATATELNTQKFEIWHSTTGTTFEKIGEVKAAGTTNIMQTYTFEDASPSPYNYYQLRSIDFDGYSETFNLGNGIGTKDCSGDTEKGVSPIYPNPNNTDEFTLLLLSKKTADAQVVIYDLTGVIVATQRISLNPGTNVNSISIANLAVGVYCVQIRSSQGISQNQRLVRI